MRDYEIFKEAVKTRVESCLPDEYKDYEVTVKSVQKVNVILDAISMYPKGPEIMDNAVPNVYLDSMYERYKLGESLNSIAGEIADLFVNGIKQVGGRYSQGKLDFKNAKENIVVNLINTEQNKEYLKTLPHREFRDLSVIYRWIVGEGRDGTSSAVVTNDLAERFGMSEEELYRAAVENTKRIMPVTIMPMEEIIKEMLIEQLSDEKEIAEMLKKDDIVEELFFDNQMSAMYVMSNEKRTFGAAGLLYADELDKVAEKLNDNLLILPSSIHETILIAEGNADPELLAEMVSEINMSQLDIGERLSNQVYRYDRNSRTLTLATDTPLKRLDGMVAEDREVYGRQER